MSTAKNNVKVQVSCSFEADASSVFNAWLDPETIAQWMFGETVRDEKIIKLETDPKEGGRFSFVVQRGNDVLNHTGTYLELRPYTRLVFTWGIEPDVDGSVVYIDITPQGNGCHLSLVHEMDPKWEAYATRTKDGWMFMLNKLKEKLK
jgi:uncharacterized protein YndB with AHSA1/START domain